MSTATEQPADQETTLAEDLAAAFGEENAEEVSAADGDGEGTETEQEADAGTQDTEVTAEADDDGTGDEADSEATEESIAPPEHWPQADKEVFSKAPKDVQEWAIRRDKELQADYTRKTQEIAQFRREYEPVDQLFEPYKDQLRAQGDSPAQVIERYIAMEQFVERDPVNAFRWLANRYNVDLSTLTQSQEPADPQIQALQSELSNLRAQVTQREQLTTQEQQNTLVQQIQSLAEEKDANGNLVRPHFNEVMDDMARLARAEQAAGRVPDVKSLYETAVWANPSIREKMLTAQQQSEQKKRDEAARAKAAAAKKAAKSVSGSPAGPAPSSEDIGLREQLERAYTP